MVRVAHFIKARDIQVFLLLNRRLQCLFLDVLMQSFTQLGSFIFAIVLPLFLYFTGRRDLVDLSVRMAAILIVSQIIVQLVKRIVNRPRPFKVLENVIAKRPPTCKYSFPSGHTCAAFSLAFVLANGLPGFGTIFYSIASMVGLSRIYLGAHYPTDILVGYFTAYASFLLIS